MKKILFGFIFFITIVSFCNTVVAQEYQVGDHELFLMPTAETMPKGSSYIANYEVILINYTYALTSSTHIGVFTIVPVTSDLLKTVTLIVKQRYLQKGSFKSAAWFTITPESGLFSVGNVFSFGRQKTNFHLGIGAITDLGESNLWELVYMGGLRHQISRKVSLLAEYTNFSTLIDEDFYGIISIGVRLHLKNLALEFGAVRPLQDTGELLFLPLLKVTIYLK